MPLRVRRSGAIAAMLCCVLTPAAPALAQGPFTEPPLRGKPKGGFDGSRSTPTPTPTATLAPSVTETAEPTPSPTATPRRGGDKELARTGADPLRLALAGFTLIGFGVSLRLRLTLGDVRRPD